MGLLTRFWKRHVTHSPDYYQAYFNFPTRRDDRPITGTVQTQIDDLMTLFEGRLDVYARPAETIVRTDSVPATEFDLSSFECVLERIDDLYRDEYVVARQTKWRRRDAGVEKSYVVVPVVPLFPRATTESPRERTIVTD